MPQENVPKFGRLYVNGDISEYLVVVRDNDTGERRFYFCHSETSAENKKAEVLLELQKRFDIVTYARKKEGEGV